eukprot:gene46971-58598_t
MSEVAHATAPPTAPPVIRDLLAKLAVNYTEVTDHPGLNPARKVQAVLLDDAVGALMVLFPQSQLLDLNRLTELTGRNLTAVAPERLDRMLGKHSLSLLPGLPSLTSSPCLYEESLLREPMVLVNSGEPGVLPSACTIQVSLPADSNLRQICHVPRPSTRTCSMSLVPNSPSGTDSSSSRRSCDRPARSLRQPRMLR